MKDFWICFFLSCAVIHAALGNAIGICMAMSAALAMLGLYFLKGDGE